MSHREKTRNEFTRQASELGKAPTFTDRKVLELIVQATGAREGTRVLDVGCGPGIVSEALASRGAMVAGLDVTPVMVIRARTRCTEAALNNAAFLEGEAESLPFAHASFDTVVSRLTIHHFHRPGTVLAEFRRVLRPGGVCVLADIVSAEHPQDAELHNALETLRDPTHVWAYSKTDLIKLVENAGFRCGETASWEMARAFREWIAITSAPERVGPVGAVLKALAANGVDAGVNLRLEEGEPVFRHSWLMVVAERT